MPRKPPSGLQSAVRRAKASPVTLSAGTSALVSSVAADARSSNESTSASSILRCSACMPESPAAPPRRASRKAAATAVGLVSAPVTPLERCCAPWIALGPSLSCTCGEHAGSKEEPFSRARGGGNVNVRRGRPAGGVAYAAQRSNQIQSNPNGWSHEGRYVLQHGHGISQLRYQINCIKRDPGYFGNTCRGARAGKPGSKDPGFARQACIALARR